MRNLAFAILLGLSLLLTATACSNQNKDIEDATNVVNEFYRLTQQGDIEAVNELLTAANRKKNEAEFQKIGVVAEYFIIFAQHSKYEIKSIKLKDDEIHAEVIVESPNSELIAEKVMQNFDASLNMDERQRFFTDNAIKILQTENIPKITDKRVMILIKENGKWKINQPGSFN